MRKILPILVLLLVFHCHTITGSANEEDDRGLGRGLQRLTKFQKLKKRVEELEQELDIIEGDLRRKCEECSCIVADYDRCMEENGRVTVSIRQVNRKRGFGSLKSTNSNSCRSEAAKVESCIADLQDGGNCLLEYRVPNYMYTMAEVTQVRKVIKFCEKCDLEDS